MFHWSLLAAMFVGVYRVWSRSTLGARFIVIYFMIVLFFYGSFDTLQGPRHRYQLDVLIAFFQFYGAIYMLRQALNKGSADYRVPSFSSGSTG